MANGLSHAMWHRLFSLSASSGLGLQDQIRQMLVSAILDGRLPLGSALPSSRRLADELSVARNTVVLAYQQLVDEGYLVSRERSGHFVNPEILGFRLEPGGRSPERAPAPHWARRLRIKPSEQRNIVKRPDWQRFAYPFLYGQFDASLFPTHEWRECCLKELSAMEVRGWAPDLIARDDAGLIREIQQKVLPRRGVWASEDEILITVGAQHALFLLADALVGPQTVVGMEDPGYPDARNIFGIRTPLIEPLAVDASGIVPSEALPRCDYVYVTPSHQCPTTVTLDLERRHALLRLAEERDFVLIEDDYESESSFYGTPTPALKSLDRNGRVIYVGSLTKAFAPGLRLGYIVASQELIREVRALRRLMLRHPSALIQRTFATFLALGHFDALQRRLAIAHRERAEALQEALARHLPSTTYVPVSGGASCWVSGPAWLDSRVLAHAAEERSVLIEPGDIFFMGNSPPRNHFRLGFSSIACEQIDGGVRELARVITELAPH
jgi:GntR family transcriptional regulator/MocR family aminotransferase